MLANLLLQFALELVQALLVDELSGRVRRRMAQRHLLRRANGVRRAVMQISVRNRKKLLHRLTTEFKEDP